jgi:hypothetical protein
MNVGSWHYGKIVLIWIAVGCFTWIWLKVVGGYNIIPLIAAIIAFVFTWKWVSGKESRSFEGVSK